MTDYEAEKQAYLQHFTNANGDSVDVETRKEQQNSPLFSLKVKCGAGHDSNSIFPQHGLLGLHIGDNDSIGTHEPILMNTNAPTSTFLCGSQGAGKSHTLACMLENCLLSQKGINTLLKPLAGVVFHYNNDGSTLAAEVADMCAAGIRVRVLVSRSNYHKLRKAYMGVQGATEKNMTVVPLLLQDHQLTISRVLQLMSFSDASGAMPLYMDVVMRILREMAVEDKEVSLKVLDALLKIYPFQPAQKTMLNQRLELLHSFCSSSARADLAKGKAGPPVSDQDVFRLDPGTLTIVDLSDPFVDASTVCVLFNICLELITAQKPESGLVVTLDEAHKYLNASDAADKFTEQILTAIRMQRHNATRVIVATQEPTISPRLLDLCSVTIVHRFTSPAWFATIKEHLSGACDMTTSKEQQHEMFAKIVGLKLGESLVFSPSSFLRWVDGSDGFPGGPGKLESGCSKMKTRRRQGRGGETRMSVA